MKKIKRPEWGSPDIDEAVAKKMGWKYKRNAQPGKYAWVFGNQISPILPSYSRLIEHAWLVVEYLQQLGGIYLEVSSMIPWICLIRGQGGIAIAMGDSPQLAICQAFLKFPLAERIKK